MWPLLLLSLTHAPLTRSPPPSCLVLRAASCCAVGRPKSALSCHPRRQRPYRETPAIPHRNILVPPPLDLPPPTPVFYPPLVAQGPQEPSSAPLSRIDRPHDARAHPPRNATRNRSRRLGLNEANRTRATQRLSPNHPSPRLLPLCAKDLIGRRLDDLTTNSCPPLQFPSKACAASALIVLSAFEVSQTAPSPSPSPPPLCTPRAFSIPNGRFSTVRRRYPTVSLLLLLVAPSPPRRGAAVAVVRQRSPRWLLAVRHSLQPTLQPPNTPVLWKPAIDILHPDTVRDSQPRATEHLRLPGVPRTAYPAVPPFFSASVNTQSLGIPSYQLGCTTARDSDCVR